MAAGDGQIYVEREYGQGRFGDSIGSYHANWHDVTSFRDGPRPDGPEKEVMDEVEKLREALDTIMWKTECEANSACLTHPDLIPAINALAREALGKVSYSKENWTHIEDSERGLRPVVRKALKLLGGDLSYNKVRDAKMCLKVGLVFDEHSESNSIDEEKT